MTLGPVLLMLSFLTVVPGPFDAVLLEAGHRDDAKAVRILERRGVDLPDHLKAAGKLARRWSKRYSGDPVISALLSSLRANLEARVKERAVLAEAAHTTAREPSHKLERRAEKARAALVLALAEAGGSKSWRRLAKSERRIRSWRSAIPPRTAPELGDSLSAPVARILDDRIVESSGLAFWEGAFWTMNDSGGEAALYRSERLDFADATAFLLPAVTAVDWECLAVLDGDLLVCDVGDNSGTRNDSRVHRVRWTGDGIELSGTYSVAYPGGPRDVEAAFVLDGRLYLVAKEDGEVLRFDDLADGKTNIAVRVGYLDWAPGRLATGASAADGLVVVLCYLEVRVYDAEDLLGPPTRTVPLSLLAGQTEAVFLIDGLLVITSEQEDVFAATGLP